jgi:hypothetical protein
MTVVATTVWHMDVAAFVIACFGFLVAALALGWQVATWFMDGRRVTLRLLHGRQGHGGFVVGPIGKDGAPRDIEQLAREGAQGPEVVGVEVTNVGRLKVKVTGYGAEAAGTGWSFNPIGDAIGQSLPHWLEPGDAETWYVIGDDARRILEAPSKRRPRGVRMFANLGTGEKKSTNRVLRF